MSKQPVTQSDVITLDAIGLARLDGFKDFPGAVSVMCEAKNLPVMDRLDWRSTSPRRFMAVWEAETLVSKFRQTHAEATIVERYKLADKSVIEFMASYDDERADHRLMLQARRGRHRKGKLSYV